MEAFAKKCIELALAEEGVREHGRNRGPEIDGYCREIGHDPENADPWCAVFVSAMVKRAASFFAIPVPIHLTAGVYTLDEKSPAELHVSEPCAGSIFIKVGHEHTGFVSGIGSDGTIYTVEGNTNPGGSSEGDGVYIRTRRREELIGFINLNLITAKEP